MGDALEIIIPTHNPTEGLLRTAESLAAQISREFSVLLSDNHSQSGLNYLSAAQDLLTSEGIKAKRVLSPAPLRRVEHWNYSHSQSRADWLKPLLPGEELEPTYVEKFQRCLSGNAKARFIRCDTELQTDWGKELLVAPFEQSAISSVEVLNYFPARIDWLTRSTPFAYDRTAWLALGGYSPQLPGSAILNLNVLFALHFGIENIQETLAVADARSEASLNEFPRMRVNHSLELWLILRQAKNYCLAAKLPWPDQCLVWRIFTAALRR